jgi:sortase (surface protein transpeptidase)
VTDRSRRPGARLWAAVAVVLAVVAVVAVVLAVTGQRRAPQAAATTDSAPGSSDSLPGPSSSAPTATEAPASTDAPADEAAAEPVAVSIPAIDVRSDLMQLGLNADGTVEVPPLERDDRAGWYEPGPEPGAVGPAVILGHVDSAQWGPGVFFDLGALEKGDEITVTRADGTVAVFAVDRVERHPKDEFPTIDVYGNTDDAQLRLITCGGAFDPEARSYEDNTIAFASLVDTRTA